MWKDSKTEIDYIDFKYISDLVNEIVLDDDLLPASIGVYGDWGSGKSSIMAISQKSLIESDKKALIINFNAWLFEGYGDAKNTVINSILDKIEERIKDEEGIIDKLKRLRKSINGFELMTTLINNSEYILSAMSNPSGSAGKTIDAESMVNLLKNTVDSYGELSMHKELRESISKFRDGFGELIEASSISRVVIYVDEMDRCLPETVLEIFEAMRLFLFNGKVAFVFGADERQISYAIRQKYADTILELENKINIGKEYLEKIIQYPIRIPTMTISETEIYLTLLLCSKKIDEVEFLSFKKECIEQLRLNTSEFSLPDTVANYTKSKEISDCYTVSKRISGLLNSGLNGNPRQFKRFLNEFELRKNVARIKNIDINEKILVKMMMLQYVRPSIFTEFIDLFGKGELDDYLKNYIKQVNPSDEGKEKERTSKTPKNIDNPSVIKKWLEDEWFEKWMLEDPNVCEENLTPYFYLSRRNDVFEFTVGVKLSDSAKKILEAYLGKSDYTITKQKDNIKQISEIECNKIIEELYNSIINDTAKKKINAIRGIVEIVQERNECIEVALSKFRMMTSSIVDKSMIVHIRTLNKYSSEINDLIEQWENGEK